MKILPLIFLILLLSTARAEALVTDGTVIPAETLAPLANWVEQATHVPIEALPITIASNKRLRSAMHLKGVQRASAAAAYLPGQIIVNSTIWYSDSLRMQSYLVHELVHHAQLLSLRIYPCGAAKEREAYMLQNQWLVEHSEEPLVSQEWIDTISSCASGNADDAE